MDIVASDIQSSESLKKGLSKDSILWNTIYKLNYDAIHGLVECLLRFEKIKADNHQCLFVFLCEKHMELEFDWDFFEKIRTKRNGIHYYGIAVGHDDWKEAELQFKLYLDKLRKEILKLL